MPEWTKVIREERALLSEIDRALNAHQAKHAQVDVPKLRRELKSLAQRLKHRQTAIPTGWAAISADLEQQLNELRGSFRPHDPASVLECGHRALGHARLLIAALPGDPTTDPDVISDLTALPGDPTTDPDLTGELTTDPKAEP